MSPEKKIRSLRPTKPVRRVVLVQWGNAGDDRLVPYAIGLPRVLETRLSTLDGESLSTRTVLLRDKERGGLPLQIDGLLPDETLIELTATLKPDLVIQGSVRQLPRTSDLEIEVRLLAKAADDSGGSVSLLEKSITSSRPDLLAHLGDLLEDLAETLGLARTEDQLRILRDFTTTDLEAFYLHLLAISLDEGVPERLRALESALDRDPGFEDAAVTLARDLLGEANPSGAAVVLESCLGHAKKSARCAYMLGLVRESLGQPEAALQAFSTFADLRPHSAVACFHLGSLELHLGRPDRARDLLQQYVSQRPHDAPGWENLAVALLRHGDRKGAESSLVRAHEIAPGEVRILLNLARLHVEKEALTEAARWLEKARALAPDHPSVLSLLGRLELEHEPEAAVELLRRALAAGAEAEDPRLPLLLASAQARCLDLQGAAATLLRVERETKQAPVRDEARRMLREVEDPDERRVLVRRVLVERFLKEGTEKESRESARELVQLAEKSPDDAEIRFVLGVALRRAGSLHAAASSHRRCLELAPDHVDALTELGVLTGQLGDLEECLDLARRALELDPGSAALVCNVGAAHLRRNELDEAEAYFVEARGLDPDDPIVENCLRALQLKRHGHDADFH